MLVVNTVQPNVSSGKSSVACGNFEEVTREFAEQLWGQSCFENHQQGKENQKGRKDNGGKVRKVRRQVCFLEISKTADGDQREWVHPNGSHKSVSTFGGKFGKQKVWSRFYPSRCPCPLSVHADGYFPNSTAAFHWKACKLVNTAVARASYASIEAQTVRFHNRELWPI